MSLLDLPYEATTRIEEKKPTTDDHDDHDARSFSLLNRLLSIRRRKGSSEHCVDNDINTTATSSTITAQDRRPHILSFDSKSTMIIHRKRGSRNSNSSNNNNKNNNRNDEVVFAEAVGWKPLTSIKRYIQTVLERGQLKELVISERWLTKDFFESLEESNLQSLSLTKVVMNGTGLSQSQFRRLLNNLPKQSLTDIEFTWSGLNNKTTFCLARTLTQFCNLQSLNLSGNHIGPRGITSLMEKGKLYKIPKLNFCCSFKYGDKEADIIARYLSLRDCQIRWLDLSMNGLSEIGVHALIRGIANNSGSIKSIRLDSSHISDEVLDPLLYCMIMKECKMIPLEELSLRSNDITGKGVSQIAKLLLNNQLPSLRKLDLGENPVDDIEMGVVAMASALGQNCSLEELSFDSCSICCEGLTAIVNALERNQRLKRLCLGNNDFPVLNRLFAPKILRTLQQSNMTLESLELLEDNYDNHLINDKLDFCLEANRCGRRYMCDLSISTTLWPEVFAKATRPDPLFLIFRERPDLFEARSI